MRVLIFEPKFVGHFLGFAAATANAFAELGCQVTLMVPKQAKGTDQAKIKLAELPERVQVLYSLDVPKMYQRWTNAKFETAALAAALDEVPTDHLVIPSGDFVLSGLLKNGALRRRIKSLDGVDLVLHNCLQVYPELGIRQRWWSFLDRLAVSLARGIRLHTVDPYVTSSATYSRMSLFGNPVHPLPHFLEAPANPPSQAEARAALKLPAQGRMLGSIGDLGCRKGTELLIESFVGSQPKQNCHLVLFGLLSTKAKQLLKENQKLIDQGLILFRNEFVSESDFYNFFYAMNVLWAGFPHQVGIASTQLYAAIAGRSVLASDYGAVGWLTKEFGLGRSVPATLDSMTATIASLYEGEDWRPDPRGLRKLLDYHTTENFNRHITLALRQRMQLSARAHKVSSVPAREGLI